MSTDTDRWTEIREIHIESADAYRIMGGVVLVGLGIWIGSLIFAGDNGYGTNLYTELISIGVTVFILDFLNRQRDERRRIQDLKDRLLRDIRSSENSVVKQAAHELSEYGWLNGEIGLLAGAHLGEANLQGANLAGASLQGASLMSANLQEVNLRFANLQRARLLSANIQKANLDSANLQEADMGSTNLEGTNLLAANLQGANLVDANLQEAHLGLTNLQGANLVVSNLKGANLEDSNLKGAELDAAIFDERTRLPDGTYWQPDIDLARFTDPNHPQFWHSDHPRSPAYRGKDTTSS